jgi:hypothetical protein
MGIVFTRKPSALNVQIVETYCCDCQKLVGASRSPHNLTIVERLHGCKGLRPKKPVSSERPVLDRKKRVCG